MFYYKMTGTRRSVDISLKTVFNPLPSTQKNKTKMSRRILLSICVVLAVLAAFVEAAPREKRQLGGILGGLLGGGGYGQQGYGHQQGHGQHHGGHGNQGYGHNQGYNQGGYGGHNQGGYGGHHEGGYGGHHGGF